jgi:DNA-binding transcriptional regulator YiaG
MAAAKIVQDNVLPQNCLTVRQLWIESGLRIAEFAEIIECPENTVKAWLCGKSVPKDIKMQFIKEKICNYNKREKENTDKYIFG